MTHSEQEGILLVSTPPRIPLVIAGAIALMLGGTLWYSVGQQVSTVLQSGDVAMGLGLSVILLIFNAIFGAVIWVAASLRDQWVLRHDYIEIKQTSLDGNNIAQFMGAQIRLIGVNDDVRSGYVLRVQSTGRATDLFFFRKAGPAMEIGQLVQRNTGWMLHLPEELALRFGSAGSGPASRALFQGPPPGLGFNWRSDREGVLRMWRKMPSAQPDPMRLGVGGLAFAVGLLMLFTPMAESLGWGPAVVVTLLGAILLTFGILPALAREQWRLGYNYLEVQQLRLLAPEPVSYTHATLAVVRLSGQAANSYRLLVMTRSGAQGSLETSITAEGPRVLGEFVAECTGWPLELPSEGRRR